MVGRGLEGWKGQPPAAFGGEKVRVQQLLFFTPGSEEPAFSARSRQVRAHGFKAVVSWFDHEVTFGNAVTSPVCLAGWKTAGATYHCGLLCAGGWGGSDLLCGCRLALATGRDRTAVPWSENILCSDRGEGDGQCDSVTAPGPCAPVVHIVTGTWCSALGLAGYSRGPTWVARVPQTGQRKVGPRPCPPQLEGWSCSQREAGGLSPFGFAPLSPRSGDLPSPPH